MAPLICAAQAIVAAEPARFGASLIAELPGVQGELSPPPFWQGLRRHFYAGDLAQAAVRAGPEWRRHVATLLPRHLIYASFLPDAAQLAIAGCALDAEALRQALHAQGMRLQAHVDGGAVMAWAPPR